MAKHRVLNDEYEEIEFESKEDNMEVTYEELDFFSVPVKNDDTGIFRRYRCREAYVLHATGTAWANGKFVAHTFDQDGEEIWRVSEKESGAAIPHCDSWSRDQAVSHFVHGIKNVDEKMYNEAVKKVNDTYWKIAMSQARQIIEAG